MTSTRSSIGVVGTDRAAASGPVLSAEEEFTAFVAVNYGRLSHVADLITGDGGRAEDLLQTVLARTYLRWSTVRQGNPLGYVRAGLVHARTDWWRRLSSRERPAAVLPDIHAVAAHAGQVVSRDAVQRALAVLTRRERGRSSPTSALRSTLYRVVATLPGVRLDGTVTDGAGRPATTVSTTIGHLRYELLFDPERATVLATRQVLVTPQAAAEDHPQWTGAAPGSVVRSVLYLRSHVVNAVGSTT